MAVYLPKMAVTMVGTSSKTQIRLTGPKNFLSIGSPNLLCSNPIKLVTGQRASPDLHR